MQTTKLLFVIGLVGTLAASELTSSAVDTPQQIQARQALRQKMAELNSLSATNTAPAATPPPAPATLEKPVTPTPPAPPPQAVPPVATPQKKAPVVPVAPVPAPPPAPAPAPAPVPTPAPAVKIPNSSEFGPVPETVANANASRNLAAMRAEMALLQRTPAVPTKSGRSTVSTALIASSPLVMEVPLDPLTGAKAARMAELLQRYQADQITPKEYHTQRAAILAEP